MAGQGLLVRAGGELRSPAQAFFLRRKSRLGDPIDAKLEAEPKAAMGSGLGLIDEPRGRPAVHQPYEGTMRIRARLTGHYLPLTTLLTLLPAIAVGCSDDSGSGSSNPLTASVASQHEGLYQITSYFQDEAACGPGSAVVDSPPFLAAVAYQFMGIQTLTLNSCMDEAECASLAQAQRGMQPYISGDFNCTISEQQSDTVLLGLSAGTGSGNDAGMCVDRTYESITMTSDGAGGITIDIERMLLADKPQDAEGYCVVEPAESKREAEAAPCVGSMSVAATRIADI